MVVGLVVIAALIYFLVREQATEPEPAPEQSQATPEPDPATDPEQPPQPQAETEPAPEPAPAAVEEAEVEIQPPTSAEPAATAEQPEQPQPEAMTADPAASGDDEAAPTKPKPVPEQADTAPEPEPAPEQSQATPEPDPATDPEQPPQPQSEGGPAPEPAPAAVEESEVEIQPPTPAEPAKTADQPQPETMATGPAAAGDDEAAPTKPKPVPEPAPADPAADAEQPPQAQPETGPSPQVTESPEDATQPSTSEEHPPEPAATAEQPEQPQPEAMAADPAASGDDEAAPTKPKPVPEQADTAPEPEPAPEQSQATPEPDPAADPEQPPQPQSEGGPAPEAAPAGVEETEESALPPTSEEASAESAMTASKAGQAPSETTATEPATDETGATRGQPEDGQASMPSDQRAGMFDEPEGAIVSDPATEGDQPLAMAARDDRSDEAAATANAPVAVAETAVSGEAGAGVAGMVGQEPVAEATVQPGDGDAVTSDVVSPAPGSGQQAVDGQVAAMPPTFDVVRVDMFGTTTIAGRAPARSLVQAIVNDEVASSQRVGPHGQFAMIFSVDTALDTLEIRLRAAFDDGTDTMSEDTVFVMVPRPDTGIADAATAVDSSVAELDNPTRLGAMDQPGQEQLQPSVLLATSEGTRMIQSPIVASGSQLLVDMISYDEKGEVIISGNASSGGSHVLIYLNDELVKSRKIAGDGTWWTGLSEVKPGRYTLRIDEIDKNGGAVARVEMPFQKEPAELAQRLLQQAARSAEESDARISEPPAIRLLAVQRGFTLWGISREHYGLGRLYVNIFTANKDQIRDPDLIYPGQIFVIPDESTLIDPLW